MDLASSTIVALVLLAAAAGMIFWHRNAWRRFQAEAVDARELEFRRRQCRRRVQTSGMLGVVGIAIFLGQVALLWVNSKLFVVLYWSGVLFLVLWMALLAMADIVATHFHYSRENTDNVIERARLQAELRRRMAKGNGRDS